MSQETPGLEQRGVDIVPKNERTVGFWDLFIIWAGFSIIMTNFLLERVMNLGENRIGMRIRRLAWSPAVPRFPHSQAIPDRVHNSL